MTKQHARMLEALRKAEVILRRDRAERAKSQRDDTIGQSVLALVQTVIAEAARD